MKSNTGFRSEIFLAILLISVLLIHISKALGTNGQYILIGAALIGVLPVLYGAYKALTNKEWASMELLASIALLFSIIGKEWTSAVFIELMLSAARILDDLTKDRAEKSISGLLKLRPKVANIEKEGKIQTISISNIEVGEVVLVNLGERVPVDGEVLHGSASIDESSITGESLPVDKKMGDKVLSGTLVTSGSLKIKTTHVGKDTTIEKVIALVEASREEKPSIQTLGEKFGKFYLISIFVGSALVFLISKNLSLVLALVLVVCADDVAVAIPIAYLRAINSAAKHGIIVKGGKHLEALGQVDTIIFDKTGTLTKGKLKVTDLFFSDDSTKQKNIELLASAVSTSKHPLSKAIQEYTKSLVSSVKAPVDFEEKGGRGIKATIDNGKSHSVEIGKEIYFKEINIDIPQEIKKSAEQMAERGESISFVAVDNQTVGFVAAADEIKKEAVRTLQELKNLGVKKTVMLTGDNELVGTTIAQKVGIDEWHSNLLPEDKVEIVRQMQMKSKVAMVGDGVNDAAALSLANVGIAMGGLGSEGAIESSEIILMHDNLMSIPTAIKLAHQATKISKQDFGIWGVTNIFGIALVFGGLIGPAGAAAYNFISDFFPLLNSLRVKVNRKKI